MIQRRGGGGLPPVQAMSRPLTFQLCSNLKK